MNRHNNTSCVLLLAALSTTQCSVFDPPKIQIGQSDGAITGGDDGNGNAGNGTGDTDGDEPWWIVTNEHGCVSVRAPTKDDRPDDQFEGESIAPIILAMSRVINGASDNDKVLTPNENAWKDIGFDRDGRCSSSPTCGDEDNPVDETSCIVESGLETEGNYCIDNAMGSLFGFSSITDIEGSPTRLIGLTDRDWNCEIHRGGFSMILKVSEYNGEKNDPRVRLDMYVSTGIQGLDKAGWSCREDITSPLIPNWTDYPAVLPATHWKIAKRSISMTAPDNGKDELDDSITFDAIAYVRNGYLVAELTGGREFVFAGDNTPIPGFRNFMHEPVLLAKIFHDPDDRSWKMKEGVLSYYVLPDEFIRTYRMLGFCENMCGSFDPIKDFIKTARDVLLSGESMSGAECTAMSLAVAFEARQATATDDDIEEIEEPRECPQPRHPDVPRQGCTCQDGGGCILLDVPDAGM